MKKEELDRQKAKYWEGKTSLEEERKLKELEDEKFFSALQPSEETIDWDFDDFIQQANEKKPEIKVQPLARRIIPMTAVAAALILAFFLIRQIVESNSDLAKPVIAQAELDNQVPDVQKPKAKDKGLTDRDDTPRIANSPRRPTEARHLPHASNKIDQKKSTEEIKVAPAPQEQYYVEINGVKIYNQEKAIEITETALQLATSNLRKGMKGVKNIKYLKIEI